MEGNNWNNRDRYRDNRNRYRDEDNRMNPDSYRGAYRLDNSSSDRNVSTWNGYGSSESNRRGGADYNQNYNRDYNRDYNRNYNSSSRQGGYDHDNYNMDSRYRNQYSGYRSGSNANWDEQYRPNSGGYGTRFGGDQDQQHRSVRSRIDDQDPYGAGNFNGNYGPDSYGQGGGENYGNEAGSLSYGYDGSSNYDPDWNSRYEPQSGHRRSYHGNYTSRHPESGQYRDNASRRPSDHNADERYF
ncbi:hypothetical protein [Pontibacter actiniarum]|uniref:Uncharacterized protein n=1 Tax=Pontibacter actiniarum TaxID=323450 RepID=A0A1X9YQW9_9BACT|nr:hypothetical protein [Pontibacter actiniarum]ARS35270.1 hypothetical protein CA264_07355 [Pontibacter actiniarum]